jgi:hypothetical protein
VAFATIEAVPVATALATTAVAFDVADACGVMDAEPDVRDLPCLRDVHDFAAFVAGEEERSASARRARGAFMVCTRRDEQRNVGAKEGHEPVESEDGRRGREWTPGLGWATERRED